MAELKWQNVGSAYYYIKGQPTGKTMAFDLDWTLTHQEHSLMPSKVDDIQLMPGRLSKLRWLNEKGWSFVVFTNQKSKGAKDTENKLARVSNFINMIPFNIAVFISTADDEYRKPSTGMFVLAKSLLPDVQMRYYVGDAAGRPHDFSNSDKIFAENAGLKFKVPEQVFKSKINNFPMSGKYIVMLVGMPGCGKTSFYKKYLEPLDYVHINQDTLGTKRKVHDAVVEAMDNEKLICIDNTNGDVEKRIGIYDLAYEDYKIIVVYIVRDGTGWNKLRESPVPDIAYHVFFKNFTRPTKYEYEINPSEVRVVTW